MIFLQLHKVKNLKLAFSCLLLFSSSLLFSQSRLTDYCLSDLNELFPEEMKNSKIWIDSTTAGIYISNFQFSESYKHDNSFYSFNVASMNPKIINLYKLGITMHLNFSKKSKRFMESQPIIAELFDEKSAYVRSFDYDKFKYTPKDYFDFAIEILRLSNDQLIANTLNQMTEPKLESKSKFDQFIDDINKAQKLKLPYIVTKEKGVGELRELLVRGSNKKISDLIFETYLLKKKEELTNREIDNFFSITGFFSQNVVSKIDQMLLQRLAVKFETPASIDFPASIIIPDTKNETTSTFLMDRLEIQFDFKQNKTEIKAFGKWNAKAKINSGRKEVYKKGKTVYKVIHPADNETLESNELRITIDQKNIILEAINSPESDNYELIRNVF
ncbi:hypothetical protein [Flavobacterium sp.]|uniref:hypothetical protein n=1 Tax=Flavobacterium sp. TaxID=239 RepID=UPI003D6BB2B0